MPCHRVIAVDRASLSRRVTTDITPSNVYIADIDQVTITEGSEKYGFTPVLISESGGLPFPDAFFDCVLLLCN